MMRYPKARWTGWSSAMISVNEALALILEDVQPLAPRATSLEDACGLVLAADVAAALNLPPFDNSAMDGFAVRCADLASASEVSPILLREAGEARAGDPPTTLPTGPCCFRIMTGAPVPRGADAVVMREDVTEKQDGSVRFSQPPTPRENIRRRGEDIAAGQVVVPAGKLLRPSEIALLAALGMDPVCVHPRPRVAILTTGDEVVLPGMSLRPGQIYDSNRFMLQALARGAGLQVGSIVHLPDDRAETIRALKAAAESCDAILSTGGVSVGDHDYVRSAIGELGEIRFWRVAMKPGKPIVFARIGNCRVFGLPGNPVSSMVGFELFVRPALRKMGGHPLIHRPRVQARLQDPIRHRPGREEYVRVMTTRLGEEFIASVNAGQGSHMISSMVAANSLAVIPAEVGPVPAGALVEVLMTEWPEQ